MFMSQNLPKPQNHKNHDFGKNFTAVSGLKGSTMMMTLETDRVVNIR